MRFAVDAHAVGRNLTGNEVYIRSLLGEFARLDSDARFVAFVCEAGAESHVPSGFECRRVSRNPLIRLGWQMASALRRERAELLHVQYTAPLACPVPVVVSVHDVSFEECPEYFPPARVVQLRNTVRRTVRQAARVLTPSEFSARRIRQTYGLDESKVTVIPNGVSGEFRPIDGGIARRSVQREFGLEKPFLLMVGDLQPRKNQLGLIAAFEELIAAHPSLPHELVFTGQSSWYGSQVRARAQNSPLRERIRFTGFATDEQLLHLYNACEIFVFPSHYEGFGIPILEAMACGRAVACSNTTACVEVADGAAITFDPTSVHEMTRAVLDLLLDAELRSRMERLGQQRASLFDWKNAARCTLEVYYDLAARGSRTRQLDLASPRR
jgi:glycosyltransferase involved in cell wall biosynthesis